jgi:hypothetical protein
LAETDALRVAVFIDLRELEAGLSGVEAGRDRLEAGEPEIEWESFFRCLAEEAAGRTLEMPVARLRLAGAYVYASLDSRNPRDRKLKDWAAARLGKEESGVNEPRGAAPVRLVLLEGSSGLGECLACDLARTPGCHHCRASSGAPVAGGVREALQADLFRLVREDAFDVAVLVSSDLGLIPIVRYLQGRGKRVIHAAFPGRGSDLSRVCAAAFDVGGLGAQISR